jgi:hypothetical protein
MFAAAYSAPVGECAKQERRPLASVLPGPNSAGDVGAATFPTSSHLVSVGAVAGLAWSPEGRPHTLAAAAALGCVLAVADPELLGSVAGVSSPSGEQGQDDPERDYDRHDNGRDDELRFGQRVLVFVHCRFSHGWAP